MNALENKPMLMKTSSSNGTGKVSGVTCHTIKLRGVTSADRQKLRIPSYSYLLP